MAAPDRANDPARKPDLRVEDVKADNPSVEYDHFKQRRAAEYINALGLNKIDRSKGQSVAGNLKIALDKVSGKGKEAREKSLSRTHDMSNSTGYGAGLQARPWTRADKHGSKYEPKDED